MNEPKLSKYVVTDKEYKKLMGIELDLPKHKDRRFEIMLCMAGAVSGGAYTAGVIDFLIQSLDEWEKVRGQDGIADHRVNLLGMSGASAGSIVGAVMGFCMDKNFPHGTNADNLLYQTWVDDIDISEFLKKDDLDTILPELPSILDSSILDRVVAKAFTFCKNDLQPPKNRPWLGDHISKTFKFIFAQTNLSGVPFNVGFKKGGFLGMTMYQDHIRFAWKARNPKTDNSQAVSQTANIRPDEYELFASEIVHNPVSWKYFAAHALGSGAFPFGLVHRHLDRRFSDYSYRFIADPTLGKAAVIQLNPDFSSPSNMLSKNFIFNYRYVCSDAGLMNNEPFELARTELAGLCGRNPPNGEDACRAVVMIDPFMDPPSYTAPKKERLLDIANMIFNSQIEASRFSANELMLADDANVFSRFLIAPSDSANAATGSKYQPSAGVHLASSGLGAFGGFLLRDYRHHDFELGRYNCQKFLRDWFSLPTSNHIVSRSLIKNEIDENPIIPLYGMADIDLPRPAWPIDKMDEEKFTALAIQIETRLKAIEPYFLKSLPCGVKWIVARIVKFKRISNVDKIMKIIMISLLDANLLSKPIRWR